MPSLVSLASRRRFRCLTLVDDYTRQCLTLHLDSSIGCAAVVAILNQLAASRGLPQIITTDNGPEFTSRTLHLFAQATGVTINHIQPGKPTQYTVIESFNGTFRNDCISQNWFSSLDKARLLINHSAVSAKWAGVVIRRRSMIDRTRFETCAGSAVV